MSSLAAKWLQTIRISWSNQMAYKANFILLVFGPMLVFFFIRYNLWSAIFSLGGIKEIRGYDLPKMLRYQGWVLVVSLLAQGMSNMQISEDIRLGRISAFLVYPFRFWQFHAASFLAFQGLQMMVAGLTIVGLRVAGVLPPVDPGALAVGVLFSSLVACVWFAVQFTLGLAGFWLEETWVLRAIFMTVAQFLSGAMLPLEVFPAWLRDILVWSPFPYLTWAPVRILMGEFDGSIWNAFGVLGLWLVGLSALATLTWYRGIRLYSAAGM